MLFLLEVVYRLTAKGRYVNLHIGGRFFPTDFYWLLIAETALQLNVQI